MAEPQGDCPPYDPELYDLVHRGNPGDLDFYLRACKGARNVLELGCGTGRVTFPLAQAGLSVTGLDNHPGMLARAREKAAALPPDQADRVSLVEGDMAEFELNETFDLVIVPYNGLYCLLSDDEVQLCLEAVQLHLAPGGQLIFDVYRVFPPDPDAGLDDDPVPVVELSDGEVRIQVSEHSDLDRSTQRLDAHYLHRIHSADGIREVTYCIPQRYLFPEQLDNMLDDLGYTVLDRWGSFDSEPFDENSETLVLIAEGSAG